MVCCAGNYRRLLRAEDSSVTHAVSKPPVSIPNSDPLTSVELIDKAWNVTFIFSKIYAWNFMQY